MKVKLVRITTVPMSLRFLIPGQPSFMNKNGFEVILISSEGSDWNYIKDQSQFSRYFVNMSRHIDLLNDIKALIQLISLFRKLKPDMVHSHTPKAGLLSMIASKLTGVPIRLHTVAGLPLMEETGIKRKILEIAERITYRCSSAVYPNSINLRNFIISNKFCAAEKLKVIGNGSSNGIDTQFFSVNEKVEKEAEVLKKQLKIEAEDFVFIFIGRVVRDKGIVELVEAFSELAKKHSLIRLLIVGPFESELDPLPKETSYTIKNNPAIIYAGLQNDIRPYLAISHALVFPSYREGFPNVPMQAGCFHLPSIVTDINGCNEIIEHNKNGLIIPVKNSAALINAMETLLMNSKLYKELKSQAREMVVEKYDQQYVWQKLLQEYKHQLGEYILP